VLPGASSKFVWGKLAAVLGLVAILLVNFVIPVTKGSGRIRLPVTGERSAERMSQMIGDHLLGVGFQKAGESDEIMPWAERERGVASFFRPVAGGKKILAAVYFDKGSQVNYCYSYPRVTLREQREIDALLKEIKGYVLSVNRDGTPSR